MEKDEENRQKLRATIERESGKLYFRSEKDRSLYQEELLEQASQEDWEKLEQYGIEKWVGERVVQKDRENAELENRKKHKKSRKEPQKVKPKKENDKPKEVEMEEKSVDAKSEKAETQEKEEKIVMAEAETEKESESQTQIPEDVVKACQKLGITKIKAYLYAKANEFSSKTEVPYVNKNGENVLLIRAADDTKNTDKYFAFQGDKLCVPGNRDEEIDQVVGRRTQNMRNGKLLQPLEIDDEEQYVEYEDSQGLVIQEKLEETMNLSTEDLKQYKEKIQEELERYSNELAKIEETPFLDDAQREQLYREANEKFNRNNEKIAKECHIDLSDVKAINLATDEKTNEQVQQEDEIEAWEVPGKRKREF